MKYLKLFNQHTDYETFKASQDYIEPNVSYCINEDEVHYNPVVTPTEEVATDLRYAFENNYNESSLTITFTNAEKNYLIQYFNEHVTYTGRADITDVINNRQSSVGTTPEGYQVFFNTEDPYFDEITFEINESYQIIRARVNIAPDD
jgi:hypothetical protein